jgi:myo-inositol-1-phosphate synthase
MIVGALGHLATTVVTGALSLRMGASSKAGMVTYLDDFTNLGLLEPGDLTFGGWDIRTGNMLDNARTLIQKSNILDPGLFPPIEEDLERSSANVFPGTAANCGEAICGLTGRGASRECASLSGLTDQLRRDIRKFRDVNRLDTVIVVNLASTEPPLDLRECHQDLGTFEESLEENDDTAVRASSLYAYAALREACPYINFTPSNGALIPALLQLAEETGVPVMGNDGKTGETLVKSALAPMFKCRNLDVMSWEGFNILGNMDGKVLDNPENRKSKIRTKDRILGKILGYAPHSRVHINHVPSLGDQKTAWDFIHFRGFLGVPMTLQFTWQGYDSILAAPLVLDLVRLTELAKRRGEAGLMPHLASFFKEPLGVEEHSLFAQFRLLLDYVECVDRGEAPARTQIKKSG